MQPTDPVVGGTVLRRAAIQSPNYVPGVSGWAIFADGTSEFNSGTFRGPVIIGAPPAAGATSLGLTGSAIPAALTGFNADYTWREADIYWAGTTTDFFFSALVHNSVFAVDERITGVCTTAGGVQIQTLVESTSPNTLNYGSSNYDTQPLAVTWRKSTFIIDGTSTLEVDTTGLWVASATGSLALQVKVTGDAGSRLTVNGDGSLHWGDGTNPTDTPLSRAGSGVLQLTGTLQLVNASQFNSVLTTFVSGDINPRHTVRTDGQLFWGPGNAATDTRLYRDSAGVLASDGIKANISGASETWHALAFANSWANAGGGAVSGQYRKNAAPFNTVDLIGVLTAGTKTDGTTIATLPAGYRPIGTVPIPVAIAPPTLAGATTPQLQVQSTGAIICFGCGSATTVYLNGPITLDA